MPAGSTRTPGTGPRRFAWRLRLPEYEVKWVLLTCIVGKVPALVGDFEHGIITIQAQRMRHHAEFRVLFDAEIDAPPALIGIATCEQDRNHLDHGRYFIGSTSVYIGTAH